MAVIYDFAGRRIAEPGVYTKRLFPSDQGAGAVTGIAVIMGEAARGGVPFDAFEDVNDCINIFNDQNQALRILGGGDAYYGTEFYLTPTKEDFGTPSVARVLIVNQMEQAKTELKNSTTSIIDIKNNIWGVDGNTTGIKISSGTNVGRKLDIIYRGASILDKDDVNLSLFEIQYTGAGSAATMTIDATTLSTTVTGTTGEDLSLTLADFSDLGSLINFINTQPTYTCTLTGKSAEFTTIFDAVTAQDIKTSAYETLAIVEAIIRQINSIPDLTATLHTGSARLIPDNLTDYQFFTGGSVAAATTQDWTDALKKLEDFNLNDIVVMSGSSTIQLLVEDHLRRMNDLQVKQYRQAGAGAGSSTTTKNSRLAEIKALNSPYFEYCVTGFERRDYVNRIENKYFEPYYLYALIAGFRYSNNVGMDLLFKYLNVSKIDVLDRQDRDDYSIAGGTYLLKKVNSSNISNFQIQSNNTTFQGSQPTRTNPAVVYEINVLTKDFEEQVEDQIRQLDTVANSVIISTIQNWITTILFPRYRDDFGWITDGPDGQKAFDNVSFTQKGEVFTVTATLTMSTTPRFVFNFLTFITPGQNI